MKKSYLMLLLVAMFALVACDNNDKPQRSEYDIAIDNLMAQCKNFDAEKLVQGLPGVWEINTLVVYNAEWSTIEDPYLVMGEMNAVGMAQEEKYTFTEDGKGAYYVMPAIDPDTYPRTINFSWHYDADNHKLTMIGDDSFNAQYTVSGFNNEYIVLDYVSNTNQNVREILKKKVE